MTLVLYKVEYHNQNVITNSIMIVIILAKAKR